MPSTFRTRGGPEILDLLGQLPTRWAKKVVRGGARAMARVVRDDAKVRVKRKSGKLARAIKSSDRIDGTLVIARIRVKGPHAYVGVFLEQGVLPHEIGAKKKGALSLGPDLVRGRVHHPGFGAMPFMRPALDTKAQEAINAMGEHIRSRLTWDELKAPSFGIADEQEHEEG